MKVSIVISTLNRADGLRDTLQSLRLQRYEDFEVVVVNGPSTDHTEAQLDELNMRIKRRRCSEANLSKSRNIGIRAAAGDVIAFLDDDALPEPDWLEEIVPHFSDSAVGGVGGIVFDNSGVSLQYMFSAANRFGGTAFADTPFDDRSFPGSWEFPYLQGTNAVFRRSALAEIGLFDEQYEYYLDETDVACRMVDRGFLLRQLGNAAVHHKFLPSDVRNEHRVVRNWFPVVKNRVYFGFRHALPERTVTELLENNLAFVRQCQADVHFHEQAGRLPVGTLQQSTQRMNDAFQEGLRQGLRLLGEPTTHPIELTPDSSFVPFTSRTARRHGLNVIFVSQDYPPYGTGGIATLTANAAQGLAALGHEVRVITRTDAGPTVDLVGNVWLHRVPDDATAPEPPGNSCARGPFPSHIASRCAAVSHETRRIMGYRHVDLVYGPIWDVEALAVLCESPLPVITHAETTMSVSCRVRDDWRTDPDFQRLIAQPLISAETALAGGSLVIHAISEAIADTVTIDCALSDRVPVEIIPLGIQHDANIGDVRSDGLRLLFVGRLEPRKGIDLLLGVAPRLLAALPDLIIDIIGNDTIRLADGTTYRERFESEHAEAWLGRLTFHGETNDAELDHHYRSCSVFVAPSRYESFGLVYLEAMRYGKPVVGSRIGGVPEIVRDGIDGLLVGVDDSEQLYDSLFQLLSDVDTRRQMGVSARQRVVDRFSVERHALDLAAMFDRVVWCRPGNVPDRRLTLADTAPRTIVVKSTDACTVTVSGPAKYTCTVAGGGIHRLRLPETFDSSCTIEVSAHGPDGGDTPIELLGVQWFKAESS